LNVGNMISSEWGIRQNPRDIQPLSINVNPSTFEPTYIYSTVVPTTFIDDFSLLSRWQMQVGLRYIF